LELELGRRASRVMRWHRDSKFIRQIPPPPRNEKTEAPMTFPYFFWGGGLGPTNGMSLLKKASRFFLVFLGPSLFEALKGVHRRVERGGPFFANTILG